MSDQELQLVAPAEISRGQPLAKALLALNNAHAQELSWLEPERQRHLLQESFLARRIGNLDASLLAFDQDARYDSPNFLWFRARYPRFVYVGRIVVAASARGHGCARRLYHDLFERSTRAGHERVVCEVNSTPPNKESDAFHAALGFVEVGTAVIHDGSKTVRYLLRALPRRPPSRRPADPDRASRRSPHVDLEAEVDFGGRHSATEAPFFRRGLDQGDLDIERWDSEARLRTRA
jgi:predicted GNAT superfamily acetyltransferase